MTPARIQASRVKGWHKPAGAVMITRPSHLGNPWIAGAPGQIVLRWPLPGGAFHRRRFTLPDPLPQRQVVAVFRSWLLTGTVNPHHWPQGDLDPDELVTFWLQLDAARAIIQSRLPELRGKTLCCACHPWDPCHGDVLGELAMIGAEA